MFANGSRYATVEDHVLRDGQGREIRYKTVRFIPETKGPVAHVVEQGERLEHVAFRFLRDPERFWRICDANRVTWPDDLISQPGRLIRVPLPEG